MHSGQTSAEENLPIAYQDTGVKFSSALSNNDLLEVNSNVEDSDMLIDFEAVKNCIKGEIKEEDISVDDLKSWAENVSGTYKDVNVSVKEEEEVDGDICENATAFALLDDLTNNDDGTVEEGTEDADTTRYPVEHRDSRKIDFLRTDLADIL